MDDIKSVIAKKSAQIVDARPAGRFAGTDPEPRPGLRGGHLPGARSVPSQSLLNDDGTLKPAEELQRIFASAGINPSQPVNPESPHFAIVPDNVDPSRFAFSFGTSQAAVTGRMFFITPKATGPKRPSRRSASWRT